MDEIALWNKQGGEHEHERPQLGSRYRYRTDLGTHCEVKIGTISFLVYQPVGFPTQHEEYKGKNTHKDTKVGTCTSFVGTQTLVMARGEIIKTTHQLTTRVDHNTCRHMNIYISTGHHYMHGNVK